MTKYAYGEVPIWRISVSWLAGVLPRTHQWHMAGRHWAMDSTMWFNYALEWVTRWFVGALSEDCEILSVYATNIIELYSHGADLNGLMGAVPGPCYDLDKSIVITFVPEDASPWLVDRWYLPGVSTAWISGGQLNRTGINALQTWAGLFVNAGCTPEQEAGWQAVNVRVSGPAGDGTLNPAWDAYPVHAVRVARYLANTPPPGL